MEQEVLKGSTKVVCNSCSCGHAHHDGENNDKEANRKKIMQITVGAVLFAAGLAANFITENTYMPVALYLCAYGLLGIEIIAAALKELVKGKVFGENFLMSVASLGAIFLGEYPEAVAVMLFYQVGEFFQEAAVRKSKRSITALMDIRPDYANVKTDTGIIRVAPETITIGDLIVVKPGEKIPLDGIVVSGYGVLDARSLTGESMPQSVGEGDAALSGCVSLDGLLTIKVTKEFGESTVNKIIDLVENASAHKASTEKFITVFARYYTPAVVATAALLAIVPPLFVGGFSEWIHRALVFLVITCPCALVISVPLSYFGGVGAASKAGILVKGAHFLEALSNIDIVVFDKTGTLTQGVFEVTRVVPANGYSEEALLSLAAHAEAYSSHPLARSILRAFKGTIDESVIGHYEETAGQGVSVTVRGKKVLAGGMGLLQSNGVTVPVSGTGEASVNPSANLGSAVYLAADGLYAGMITVSDSLRPTSREAVSRLKRIGVRRTVMLTGDNAITARRFAGELGIDEYFAQLLPHEKVEKVEALEQEKKPSGKLIFVGDGINDAPVLARSDIGAAMGGLGSDAAIEAADVVLMTDDLNKLADAVTIARKTQRVVRQNIVFALGVKLIIMVLGAVGIANMWAAVFADVGVSLIAIMNALRVLRED